jgi:hypothetical protein
MDAQQPTTLQQALLRIQQLEGQVQEQQELIAELQQQQPEVEEEDGEEEWEWDDENDPMAISGAMVDACMGGVVNDVIRLIEEGKNVNCADIFGNTPIGYAKEGSSISVFSIAGNGSISMGNG